MREEIIKKFVEFSQIDIYQWLITSAIHPSNQKFIIRYEFLIHTLLSIEENRFSNAPLSQNQFQLIIQWFEEKYSNEFLMLEDWEPFDQQKLTPIFFERVRYYFFYGALERPFEMIKQFLEIFFTEESEKLNDLKKVFLFSLEFQTKILETLKDEKEARISQESMYVPTINFLKKYISFFICTELDDHFLHNSETDYIMGENNFTGIYTKIGNIFFVLPPQFHIEIFYQIGEKFLYSAEMLEVIEKVNQGFEYRCNRMIGQFFGITKLIHRLVNPKNKLNVINYFESMARVDSNKILLFKNVSHSTKSFEDNIIEVAKTSMKRLDEIKKHPYLGLNYYNEENVIVPTEILTFIVVIIYERLSLNYILRFAKNWKESDIFIFNYMDLKPIFELLLEKESQKDISFLQYLRAEKEQSTHNIGLNFQFDALDSFANYYTNETFFISGVKPTMTMYSPHSWSGFYNEFIYKKYEDDIYELVEKKYPNRFNIIKRTSNDTYECIDTFLIEGGKCVKFKNKLIWIMYPVGVNSTEIEVRGYTFLGKFISFYLDMFKNKIFNLLLTYHFDFDVQDFAVGLYPNTLIEMNNGLNHLRPYLSDLSSNPILFLTRYFKKYNKTHTFIIFKANEDSLAEVFKLTQEENPEKKIFKGFLISILKFLKVKDKEKIAQEFIDQNWNIEGRAFSFDINVVDNPKLENYRNPKKIQDSFIAIANQEVVIYLKELNIEPKEYWERDAKELNNLIYNFLQNKLESEISKFNNSILYYAYTEIEYIEGKREQDNRQAGLDSSKFVAFDVNEKYNKERLENSQLAIASKHILHTILKVNPLGIKAIVDSDWYYLLALSTIINETLIRSDYLYYSIEQTGIKISDIYELIDIEKSSQIDFEGYHQKITSSKIVSSKNRFQNKPILNENRKPEKVPIFDKELNEVWHQEFGFYLDDMVVVLNFLGRYNYDNDVYFPLNLISMEKLTDILQKYILEPPSKDEIEKIINFLSLDFTTFSNSKNIDYSIDRLLQKKERINLSPFIMINKKYLFGNQQLLQVSKSWINQLLVGDVPFTMNDKPLVENAIKRIHRELDLELEQKAYEIAKDVLSDKLVEKNIMNFKRLSKDFPNRPPCGEIDLMAVNKKTKTIFIMDAKNVNRKLYASAIDRELRVFFHGRDKKKSHLEKLNMKVQFVVSNLEKILDHFNITDKQNWKIKKGFIVNTLYLSAFYKEKVDFVLIDELINYINGS